MSQWVLSIVRNSLPSFLNPPFSAKTIESSGIVRDVLRAPQRRRRISHLLLRGFLSLWEPRSLSLAQNEGSCCYLRTYLKTFNDKIAYIVSILTKFGSGHSARDLPLRDSRIPNLTPLFARFFARSLRYFMVNTRSNFSIFIAFF